MEELYEAYLDVYDNIDEANRWERESGIGGNSPEAELARMRSRAFHTGGVKSKKVVNPSDINSGSLKVNRGVARMINKRNRGKSPSDPTYSHRKKIDPLKIPSYRESPLGLPRGYKDPLKSRANNNNSDRVNSNVKPLQTEAPINAKSNIRKFQREELEYILDVLVSEGYVSDYNDAAFILEAMSDEWIESILTEGNFTKGVASGVKKAVKDVANLPTNTLSKVGEIIKNFGIEASVSNNSNRPKGRKRFNVGSAIEKMGQ